jgi:phosphatidylserine/phosphatidylglycerophosphate/cardiolipin synthase-like enzyme
VSKKRWSSKERLQVVSFIILVLVVVFGLFMEQTENTQIADPVIPIATEEVQSAKDNTLISVFFTDPEIPFDDIVQGGLDEKLVEIINGANESIYVAVFELDLQNVTDALISAHNRGVQVRLVYDNEHCDEDGKVKQLVDAGIPAIADERSALMHNKFFVIDGEIVWTGSLNITVNGAYRNNNNVIVIRSTELAENYLAEFDEMFAGDFGPTSPSGVLFPTVSISGNNISAYFSPEDDPLDTLVGVVSSAEDSIHFMAFSFTSDELGQAMVDNLALGIEVHGLFETRGANTKYSECNRLLLSGADVRLDGNPRTMHHKVIIIDGTIVVTGSFNFSANAAESNDENLLIIWDPEIAKLYEVEFERLMSEGKMLSGECRVD